MQGATTTNFEPIAAAQDAGSDVSFSEQEDQQQLQAQTNDGAVIEQQDAGDEHDDYTPVPESFPGETATPPRNDRGQFTSAEREAREAEAIERAAFEAVQQGKLTIDPAAAVAAQAKGTDAQAQAHKSNNGQLSKDERKAEAKARWALARVGLSDAALDKMEHTEILAEFERVKPFLARVDPNILGADASNAQRLSPDQAAAKAAGHARDGVHSSRQASNAGEADEDDIDTLLREIDGEQTQQRETQRAASDTTQLHPAQVELAKMRVAAAEKAVKSEFESAVKSATEEQQREYMQLVAELDPQRKTLVFGSEQEIASLLRKAAWAVFGPQIKQQQHQDVLLRNRRQRAGQPSSPDGRSRSASAPMSDEEWERHAFEVVQGRAQPIPQAAGSVAR